MSWQAVELVYRDKSLAHKSGRAVMLALAHRHNFETGQCNPSIRTLMDMTQQSSQGVRNGLKFLSQNIFGKSRVEGADTQPHTDSFQKQATALPVYGLKH